MHQEALHTQLIGGPSTAKHRQQHHTGRSSEVKCIVVNKVEYSTVQCSILRSSLFYTSTIYFRSVTWSEMRWSVFYRTVQKCKVEWNMVECISCVQNSTAQYSSLHWTTLHYITLHYRIFRCSGVDMVYIVTTIPVHIPLSVSHSLPVCHKLCIVLSDESEHLNISSRLSG